MSARVTVADPVAGRAAADRRPRGDAAADDDGDDDGADQRRRAGGRHGPSPTCDLGTAAPGAGPPGIRHRRRSRPRPNRRRRRAGCAAGRGDPHRGGGHRPVARRRAERADAITDREVAGRRRLGRAHGRRARRRDRELLGLRRGRLLGLAVSSSSPIPAREVPERERGARDGHRRPVHRGDLAVRHGQRGELLAEVARARTTRREARTGSAARPSPTCPRPTAASAGKPPRRGPRRCRRRPGARTRCTSRSTSASSRVMLRAAIVVLDFFDAVPVTETHRPRPACSRPRTRSWRTCVVDVQLTVVWPELGFCTSMLEPLSAATLPDAPIGRFDVVAAPAGAADGDQRHERGGAAAQVSNPAPAVRAVAGRCLHLDRSSFSFFPAVLGYLGARVVRPTRCAGRRSGPGRRPGWRGTPRRGRRSPGRWPERPTAAVGLVVMGSPISPGR